MKAHLSVANPYTPEAKVKAEVKVKIELRLSLDLDLGQICELF